jgi:hypothetical protein
MLQAYVYLHHKCRVEPWIVQHNSTIEAIIDESKRSSSDGETLGNSGDGQVSEGKNQKES